MVKCISVIEFIMWMNKIWTDKYDDTIHIALQSLNPRFVVAFSFFSVKRPQWVSTAIEISYHSFFWGFSVRVTADRATVDRWIVQICCFVIE
jgi:hypothetical protein